MMRMVAVGHRKRFLVWHSMAGVLCAVVLLLYPLSVSGQCSGPVCGVANTQGTDFWLVFLNNRTVNYPRYLTLLVAGSPGTVVQAENPNSTWSETQVIPSSGNTTIVVPNNESWFSIQSHVYNSGIHVTASSPVSLYASNYVMNTYDIAMVLPTPTLRTRYMVQTYQGADAEVAVVAVCDNTVLTFSEIDSISTDLDGNPVDTAHMTRTLPVLMRGQAAYLNMMEITGSVATSNGKPFALFQGNRCATVGGVAACDHLFEQAIPADYWGEHFLLVSTAARQAGDLVRITSLEDSCEVYIDSVKRVSLNRGETWNYHLMAGTAKTLTSTQPVCACLYFYGFARDSIVGDPSSVIIPPLEQRVERVRFQALNTVNTSRHYVNIVCRTVDLPAMQLNGGSIQGLFSDASSGYSYARVAVPAGTHTLSNMQGGLLAYFYGLGSAESYAYNAGMATHDLRYRLYVEGHDSRTYTGLFSYCQGDTAHLRVGIRGRTGGGVSASWLLDSVSYGTTLDSIAMPLEQGGWVRVSAVVSACDTLSAMVYVHPHRYDSTSLLLCDVGQYTFVDTLLRTSGTYSRPFTDERGCPADSLLVITIDSTAHTLVVDSFCFNRHYMWQGERLDTAGRYEDTLTSASGCDSVATLELTMIARPEVSIAAAPHCRDGTYTLSTDLSHMGWPPAQWVADPPDTTLEVSGFEPLVTARPHRTTLYSLDIGWQCPFEEHLLLHPLQWVRAEMKILPERPTIEAPWFDAYNTSLHAKEAEWAVDGVDRGYGQQIRHYADPLSDSTVVRLVAHNGMCTDTAYRSVPFLQVAFWAPNVFTPDESVNNRFEVTLHNAAADELYIYNRHGALMYHGRGAECRWDGTHHGTPCPQGAYVWHLIYRTEEHPNDIKKRTGTVTLLR